MGKEVFERHKQPWKADEAGTLRMLALPRDTTVRGPGQFQNDIESSPESSQAFQQTLSQFLSLNRQQGSDVIVGNLLTLPVGDGLLYVEPIYVQARSGWRPTLTLQAQAGYNETRTPKAATSLFKPGYSETNSGVVVLSFQQPLWTGGRVAASVSAATADILQDVASDSDARHLATFHVPFCCARLR